MHAAAPFVWPAIAPAPSDARPCNNSSSNYQSSIFLSMLLEIASPVSPVSQA